jgi:dephospho-CoA kinase
MAKAKTTTKKTAAKPAAPVVSEGKVCREIIDRNNVLSTSVVNVIIETIGNKVERSDLANLDQKVKALFTTHTDGLVNQVGKHFSGK